MPLSIDVALVAYTPDGDEQLGVAYVAGALSAAGHRPHLYCFGSLDSFERTARGIAETNAPLVGIAMPSGMAAIHGAAMAKRLRSLGLRSHITIGGPFATLARRRLLDHLPEIDSVVRHDGEIPIMALANALAHASGFDAVPGLSTRDGEGPPAPVGDPLPLRTRPFRGPLRTVGGFARRKVLGVRGCWGRCRYCGLAALRVDAMREPRGGPGPLEAWGRGAMRRRPIDDLADELADLYHRENVRCFQLIDENHLPGNPREAIEVIERLRQALDKRHVGPRALNMMFRSDIAANREVVDALARLGVTQALLGVESTTEKGLRSLRRTGLVEHHQQAMDNLTRANIAFHYNLLLIRPDSTLQTIEQEVNEIERLRGGLLDPYALEAYEGTDLFEELKRSHRLQGGPFLWWYSLSSPEMERFGSGFRLIRAQSFETIPLTLLAFDTLAAASTARRLGLLGRPRREVTAWAARLAREHDALWVDVLRSLARWARTGEPRLDELAEATRVRSRNLLFQFQRLSRQLLGREVSPLGVDARGPRVRAATAVATGVVLAACGARTDVPAAGPETDASTWAPAVDGGSLSETSVVDVGDGENLDSAMNGIDGDIDSEATAGCDASASLAAINDAMETAFNQCGCPLDDSYRFVLDADGRAIDVESYTGSSIDPTTKACLLGAVSDQLFPCLADQTTSWEQCPYPRILHR